MHASKVQLHSSRFFPHWRKKKNTRKDWNCKRNPNWSDQTKNYSNYNRVPPRILKIGSSDLHSSLLESSIPRQYNRMTLGTVKNFKATIVDIVFIPSLLPLQSKCQQNRIKWLLLSQHSSKLTCIKRTKFQNQNITD